MHTPAASTVSPTRTWASFAFSFTNSLGTGVVTSGVYFLTSHFYAFSRIENYALGVTQGAMYVAGALYAGRIVRGLKGAGLSTRGVLLCLMLVMCVLCAIPMLAMKLPAGTDPARPAAWPIWATVTLYSPLTGVLWPLIESYVSGGRRGENLRSTVGWWNVVWSSALILAYFGVSPLVEKNAPLALLLLGGVHLLSAPLLLRFAAEPAGHPPEEVHRVPEVYPRLLVTFRMLLPMSYLLLSTMLPYLPMAMGKLGVPVAYQTMLNDAWLLPRTLAFVLVLRWAGWHGRWWPALAGGGLLLGGFAGIVLAGQTIGGPSGLVVLVCSMACFGLGMAMTYCGALYYAMEVGNAQVEAGGMHEALIGLGYTVGPAIGLGAALGMKGSALPAEGFELIVLGVVAVISTVGASLVVRRVAKHSRVTAA